MTNTLHNILLFGPPLLIAVILHEVAHGYAAERLGDPTARRLGRITLNPLVHIDPFLTVILPALLIFSGSPIIFGGAKPVPVNPLNFRNPRRGMAYVALAGPVTNFAIAGICYASIRLILPHIASIPGSSFGAPAYILAWLQISILINLVLGLFNLLPIPPLDGGRIAVGFLPANLAVAWARLERFGILIVVALLYTGVVERILSPILEFATGPLQRLGG